MKNLTEAILEAFDNSVEKLAANQAGCRTVNIKAFQENLEVLLKNRKSMLDEYHQAVTSLLEIGKRNLTNAKYDVYFNGLLEIKNKVDKL